MTEKLTVSGAKDERYKQLVPQIKNLLDDKADIISDMANISAALKFAFKFFWVGFYRVKGKELCLGPFQGDIACTRIPYGKGVCGTAWAHRQTIIVSDVNRFPGHIACSSESQSEIVVPVFNKDEIIAVLDIDSNVLNDFDTTDAHYLEIICSLLTRS